MTIWVGPPPPFNYKIGRGGAAIDRLVLHTTVGPYAGALARFMNPREIASAHYIVCLDGSVKQIVKDDDTAYHAGDWAMNLRSIGIEHEDGGDYNGPRTPELYAASSALVHYLCNLHAIPLDRDHIRLHREVSDSPTACPDALDWALILAEGNDMTAEQDARLKHVEAQLDVLGAAVGALQAALASLAAKPAPAYTATTAIAPK